MIGLINKIKNNKLLIVILILIIILGILLVSKITFAYLERMESKAGITTGEIDSGEERLYFTNDEDLSLTASVDNFSSLDKNLSASVYPKVTLIANPVTKNSTSKYIVGIIIKNNTFTYSQENNAELILTITGPDNTASDDNIIRTSADNKLEFKTIENTKNGKVEGFDVTNKKGIFNIVVDQEITSTDDTVGEVQEWTFTLTFINYEFDQSVNETATFIADIVMQEEKMPTSLVDACSADEAVGECVQKLVAKYDYDMTNIVYHNTLNATEKKIPNAEKVAGDDSYRYVGDNPNNYVCFGPACSNEGTDPNYKNLYRIIGFFKNEDDTSDDYGNYEMKIIKADLATKEDLGEGTYPESAYRSNGSTSSYLSTYKGKLTNFGNYAWNDTAGTSSDNNNVNMWAASNLNTKNLNGTYYNAIDGTYKSMVVEHKWEVGVAWSSGDAKSVFDYELGSNKLNAESNYCYTQGNTTDTRLCSGENDLTYKASVGLMYMSDYMYGTLPDYWSETAVNYNKDDVKNNDWLYLGVNEWTISRYENRAYSTRDVNATGSANYADDVYAGRSVRPVLYLSSNVKITGGSGTDSDPYKLAM